MRIHITAAIVLFAVGSALAAEAPSALKTEDQKTFYTLGVALGRMPDVSAFDALGSLGISPIGLVVAGPVAAQIGIDATLWIGVTLVVVPTALVLLVPEVWTLRSGVNIVDAPA